MATLTSAGRRHIGMLSGGLFVLLWLAGMFLQDTAGYPRPTDSMLTVRAFFQASGDSVERSAGLHLLSAVALLGFAGVLAGLRRQGRPGPAPYVASVGGVVAAGMLLTSAAATLSLVTSDLVSDAAASQLLYQFSFWTGGPMHVAALGLMIAAAAYGFRGLLPSWLTWSGLAIGVAGMLAAFTAVVPAAVLFTPIGRFLGLAWLLGATLTVGLRRTPGGGDA